MNIKDLKVYLESNGFEYQRKGVFLKEYGDNEIKVGVEYQIKLPRVNMFMIDSVGRKKKTLSAKIKDIHEREDGSLSGFNNIINKRK